jgi:hypothetical protein
VTAAQLATAANLREDVVEATLALLVGDGLVRPNAKPIAYVDGAAADAPLARVDALLATCHSDAPYALGLTSLALALAVLEPLLIRVLASAVEDARLA